jgi:Tfp pilus assembly protein PilO
MKATNNQKRNQFILVALVTLGIIAGLWLGLIKSQQSNLRELAAARTAAAQRLQQAKQAIQISDQVDSQFCEAKKRLDKIEETMATGDLYSWAINTIRQFKLPYKVEIPQFSQVDGPKEMAMLARFPYKQATWTIAGTAQFHDFGKFLADFENQFPYSRVLNLSLEPVSGAVATEKERLAFRLEIVALVKPGVS